MRYVQFWKKRQNFGTSAFLVMNTDTPVGRTTVFYPSLWHTLVSPVCKAYQFKWGTLCKSTKLWNVDTFYLFSDLQREYCIFLLDFNKTGSHTGVPCFDYLNRKDQGSAGLQSSGKHLPTAFDFTVPSNILMPFYLENKNSTMFINCFDLLRCQL